MDTSKTFERILDLIERKDVLISEHGYDELAEDGIIVSDLISSISRTWVYGRLSPELHPKRPGHKRPSNTASTIPPPSFPRLPAVFLAGPISGPRIKYGAGLCRPRVSRGLPRLISGMENSSYCVSKYSD